MMYSADPAVDRSLRHSVRDGMAYSVMAGGGETYLSAYALFLKATAPQVALVTTLPTLLGSLAQLFSAWVGRRVGRRKPIILVGAALQGLTWLPLLALPLLFPAHAVPLLLGIVTLYFAGGHLATPQWTSLMGDLVTERRRGRFFARRTRLNTMASFVALALAGVVLHYFDGRGHTAAGFATLFLVAFGARMVSVYHLACMREPRHAASAPDLALSGEWLCQLRHTGAPWFSLYFVLMQTAVGIAAPFFSVYMLRDLHFSYLQFMANTATAVLVQFLTLNQWGRISDAFGNRLILVVTSLIVPFLPALWTVCNDFWYLLGLQALSGLAWAGFSLSSGNLLYDLVPTGQRAAYSAVQNVLAAAGVFLGGMLGAVLIPHLPQRSALLGDPSLTSRLISIFLVSTLVRLAVAGIVLRRVKELRRPRRRISARAFVFRATRFSAFVGIMYEFVTLFRRTESSKADASRLDTDSRT